MTDTERIKQLEEQVKRLEIERDTWKDAATAALRESGEQMSLMVQSLSRPCPACEKRQNLNRPPQMGGPIRGLR